MRYSMHARPAQLPRSVLAGPCRSARAARVQGVSGRTRQVRRSRRATAQTGAEGLARRLAGGKWQRAQHIHRMLQWVCAAAQQLVSTSRHACKPAQKIMPPTQLAPLTTAVLTWFQVLKRHAGVLLHHKGNVSARQVLRQHSHAGLRRMQLCFTRPKQQPAGG